MITACQELQDHGKAAWPPGLVLLLTYLLTVPFAGKRFFDALLLAGFQVKRMTLDLFNNVFGLDFALEAAQGIFEGFAFLYANLCQGKYTSQSGLDQANF